MEFSSLLPLGEIEAMKGNSSYEQASSVHPGNHENLHCIDDASAAEHVNPVEDASGTVGQAFKGVVESVFDAGCVISVKLGNSNITLRGIVFKPGHYTPVTAENDVAPGLQFIRGNETHLANQNQSHARQRRPKERHQRTADYIGNDSSAQTHGDNLLSTRHKRSAVVAAPSVPLARTRGTVVPVVLGSGNAAVAAQTANNMAPPKAGKNSQTVSQLSTFPKLPGPHLRTPVFYKMPKDVSSEHGPYDHGT